MWIETKIEKELTEKIKQQSCDILNTHNYVTNYNMVKSYFIGHIYSKIASIEPNLTDHGEVHIQNVLQNAYELINNSNNTLSGVELYVLCMGILVHDIGNLSGRKGHESKLKEYFNITKFSTLDRKHITSISQIAKSHGGIDCDTIGTVTVNNLDGVCVRGQKIAAILRFADELAEGKQRTSLVMLEKDLISKDSRLYHIYASILDRPAIIKDTISLDYSVYIDEHLEMLKELLAFIHERVDKLYKELLYCGHYCDDINRIKKVSVCVSIFKNKDECEVINIQNELLKFELSGQNTHCKQKLDFEVMYLEIIKSLELTKQQKIPKNSKTSIKEKVLQWFK